MSARRWRIAKERVYDRETRRWTHHKAWSLYLGKKRIARYLRWQMCVDHIAKVYEKWPNFDGEVGA